MWNGAGTTQDRVNKLKVGVTGVKLDDTTVHVLEGVNDDVAHDLLSSEDGGLPGAGEEHGPERARDREKRQTAQHRGEAGQPRAGQAGPLRGTCP